MLDVAVPEWAQVSGAVALAAFVVKEAFALVGRRVQKAKACGAHDLSELIRRRADDEHAVRQAIMDALRSQSSANERIVEMCNATLHQCAKIAEAQAVLLDRSGRRVS